MNKINDGGPAFPMPGGSADATVQVSHLGMSLRDWFAGNAPATPQYYMRDEQPKHGQENYEIKVLQWEAKRRASWCYSFADAMIAAGKPAESIPAIDLAWEAVNALGGSSETKDPIEISYRRAIESALNAIEKLGGKDPAPQRAAIRAAGCA